MNTHICPVCGYDRLIDPPSNFTICPSCGTEFEYDDAFSTHAQLRATWLKSGAKWWSPLDPEPPQWEPYSQVNNVIDALPIWTALRYVPQLITGGLADLNTIYGQPPPSRLEALGTPPRQLRTAQAA